MRELSKITGLSAERILAVLTVTAASMAVYAANMGAQTAALRRDWFPVHDSPPAIFESSRPPVLGEVVSDYGLAQAAAAHDMRALGELYERHKHRVYAVCTRMTRSQADADDLTQEVFLHLVKKVGTYRGESQFTTWLHRLTVNCVLMYFRRPSRRENNFSDLENVVPIAPRLLTPEPARIADRIAFQTAISQLPRGCRTVFVLFEIAGYEHDEIARLLGCSSGTSKSQLHRARAKLRKLLTIH